MRRTPVLALALTLVSGASLAPSALAAGSADDPSTAPSTWLPSASRQAPAPALAPRAISTPGGELPSDPAAYLRIAGTNRYDTAVQISQAYVCAPTETSCDGLGGVDAPVEVVFVASASNYPDALGAGPLAYGLGPLLLVPAKGTVPTVVKSELKRIKPQVVVVIGGTGAVSASVEEQLEPYASGGTDRISGDNRYETAAYLAYINDSIWRDSDDDGDGNPDDHGVDTVVLASGAGFADALGGGGAAANTRGALLLTGKDSLPEATRITLQDLDAPTVYIVGGTGAVSSSVVSKVKAAVPDAKVVRASGSDRYATAADLSRKVFGSAGAAFVVNGRNFPDALASAPLAGLAEATTLLTKGSCVTPGTRDEASRLSPTIVVAIGGETVVGDEALHLGTC